MNPYLNKLYKLKAYAHLLIFFIAPCCLMMAIQMSAFVSRRSATPFEVFLFGISMGLCILGPMILGISASLKLRTRAPNNNSGLHLMVFTSLYAIIHGWLFMGFVSQAPMGTSISVSGTTIALIFGSQFLLMILSITSLIVAAQRITALVALIDKDARWNPISTFFLLVFYPIGVFFIQPKLLLAD